MRYSDCGYFDGFSPNEACQTSIAIIFIHFTMIDPNRFKKNVSVYVFAKDNEL